MIPWNDIGQYAGVFFALVISAFGVPIPEELAIVTGGVLVGREWNNPDSWMKWWIMLPVCIAGVVMCDIILYVIGRKWGTRLLTRKWVQKRVLPPEKREKIEKNFHDYGIAILLVARLLPGIRSPIFIMSGVMRVPFRKFLFADGLYAIPGVNLLFWLAYWFTDQFLRAVEKVEGNRPIVVAVILAAVAGFLFYQFTFRRRVATGDPQELPGLVKQVATSISHHMHAVEGKKLLVGQWEAVETDAGTLPKGAVVDFEADGNVSISFNKDDKPQTSRGTYAFEGESFSVVFKNDADEATHQFAVKRLTELELECANDTGGLVLLKRVKQISDPCQ